MRMRDTAGDAGVKARCDCGAVTFSAPRPPVLQLLCHCRDCQAATGAAFARLAFFSLDGATVVGAVQAQSFTAASGNATVRERCAACGTVMFDRSTGFPGLLGVIAERLSPPFVFKPVCHVWTDSGQPTLLPDDGLRRFPRNFER